MQLFPQPHKVFACCRKTYVITLGWLPRNNSPRSETYGSDNWYISLHVTAQLLSLGAVGSVLCKLSSFSQVHGMLLSLHSAQSLNAVKSTPFISSDNSFSKGKSYSCLSYRHFFQVYSTLHTHFPASIGFSVETVMKQRAWVFNLGFWKPL